MNTSRHATPSISVVVPTKDSVRELPRLLTSLERQTSSDFEVLVVDGGSSDGTLELVQLRECRVLHGGKAAASRNVGATLARGHALLFLDSDMEAPPGLIAACARYLGEFPVVYLREVVISESWWGKARGFEKLAVFRSKYYEAPRCILRRVFESVGGYDNRFGNDVEDMELQARILHLGLPSYWLDNPPLLHHEHDLDLTRYLAKRKGRPIDLLREVNPEFWREFTSPTRRLSLLLRQLVTDPRPRNLIYIGLVGAQRLLEYRTRVGAHRS